MKKIERYAFSEKPDLEFDYDPMGQRITKTVYPKSAPGVIDVDGVTKTYYVYDSQGNVMTVYTLKTEEAEKNLYLSERMLYGSTRLGMEQVNQIVASTEPTNIDINTAQQRVVGDKRYELSNHLGNVLATVTDRKLPEFDATESLAYYKPDVVSYSDYMPFGMQMAERNGSTGDYRYGFQGQEKDDEIKGEGNSLNYTFRMHDPRVGRFFAVDPLTSKYPFLSPYAFSENSVIHMIELEGLEATFNEKVIHNISPFNGVVQTTSELKILIASNVKNNSTVMTAQTMSLVLARAKEIVESEFTHKNKDVSVSTSVNFNSTGSSINISFDDVPIWRGQPIELSEGTLLGVTDYIGNTNSNNISVTYLGESEGAINEMARTLAHEMGHMLGLTHPHDDGPGKNPDGTVDFNAPASPVSIKDSPKNLINQSSYTDGTEITSSQIMRVLNTIISNKGVKVEEHVKVEAIGSKSSQKKESSDLKPGQTTRSRF